MKEVARPLLPQQGESHLPAWAAGAQKARSGGFRYTPCGLQVLLQVKVGHGLGRLAGPLSLPRPS